MEALFSSAQILTGREIQEKKSVIAELTNFEKAFCGMLKERNSSRKVQGFTFYASVKGSQMTYPAGKAAAFAQFSCFTGIKVQILTLMHLPASRTLPLQYNTTAKPPRLQAALFNPIQSNLQLDW
jgi:hypothetical protein